VAVTAQHGPGGCGTCRLVEGEESLLGPASPHGCSAGQLSGWDTEQAGQPYLKSTIEILK